MPEEKEYFVGGNNYLDGKDRRWTESEIVLVVNDNGGYFTDSTRNGKFRSEWHKDCDGWTHNVLAWMPILKFNWENPIPKFNQENDDDN